MSIEKSTMKAIGYAAAIVTFLAAQFWGVPFYIESEVTRQVKVLNESAAQPQEVTTLVVQMEAVDAFMLRSDASDMRIEGKIDHLTDLFIADLNRRAAQ